MEYIFRIEKRSPQHPLTPQVLVEFGCDANNPKAMIDAVGAVVELLKIHKTPEAMVEWMRRSADFQQAKLFVEETFSKG